LFSALVLIGCGGDACSGDSCAEEDIQETTPPSFGEACESDDECLTGLCVNNDYAPFAWCSMACELDKSPCPADSAGNSGGWCTKFPDDFGSEIKQLCLPLCNDFYECTSKSELWKTCEPPAYKGNPLHPDATGVRVCQTPAAHGLAKVDPITCEGWDTVFGNDFEGEANVCRSYCDYLVTCQEVEEPARYNKECCGHGCLQRLITEDGVVNDIELKKIKCYVQNFYSFQGTPEVCTAHKKDGNCAPTPEDTRPQ
jgi:hypothetical protein